MQHEEKNTLIDRRSFLEKIFIGLASMPFLSLLKDIPSGSKIDKNPTFNWKTINSTVVFDKNDPQPKAVYFLNTKYIEIIEQKNEWMKQSLKDAWVKTLFG